MTRELFVSSTPHETKVGMVEDDLLAEIYLERENEYTLAGSIYKGRVTRVLPGMQSAFVDIGLERDAFLYVSDFMELEDSEDLDEVPTNRPAPERYQPQPPGRSACRRNVCRSCSQSIASRRNIRKQERRIVRPPRRASPATIVAAFAAAAAVADAAASACRNRSLPVPARKRRARLRAPNALNATERTHRTTGTPRAAGILRTSADDPNVRRERDRPERSEYGPPPGYQPIILPGESISKYQRLAQTRPAPSASERPAATPVQDQPAQPIAEIFADDEPIFAAGSAPVQLRRNAAS